MLAGYFVTHLSSFLYPLVLAHAFGDIFRSLVAFSFRVSTAMGRPGDSWASWQKRIPNAKQKIRRVGVGGE